MKFIRQNKFHLRYVNQVKCLGEIQERKAESDATLMPQIVNLDTFFKPIF